MQTFMPLPTFAESLGVLDWRRLGKQRVEAEQIRRALTVPGYGWQNHPAVKMWRGYVDALTHYRNLSVLLWEARGYRNTMDLLPVNEPFNLPGWMGDEAFHASHRSNLLRKDPDHYGALGWSEPDDLEYVWPKEQTGES